MKGPTPSATLDIDALRAFLAVADMGGVTAAAERVGRTPAAVSMQLKKLEETLGRPLFERRPRGMRLSEDGERLLSYAQRILCLHGDALTAFRGSSLSGEVSIGVIEDFGGVRLANALSAFSESHCGVMVRVSVGTTTRLHSQLDRRELDMALLTPGCVTDWRDGDDIVHEEPLVWVGRRGGRACARTPTPVALGEQGCAWRKGAIAALTAADRSYRLAYVSDFSVALKAAVASDLAVSVLPRSVVEEDHQVLGPEHGFLDPGRLQIALRWADGDRSPAAEALAERLRAEFARQGLGRDAA